MELALLYAERWSPLAITIAGSAICAWAFWRLNETPSKGDWALKIIVLLVFLSGSLWGLDQLSGNYWRSDGALFFNLIAAYLWWGVAKHRAYRDRRGRRRSNGERGTEAR